MNKSCIHVGNNYLKDCGGFIKAVSKATKVCIITDSNVAPLYLNAVVDSLNAKEFETFSMILPAGESIKSIDTYEKVLNFLSDNEFTRNDLLVALGGGTVGDLTGFVASTYLRGIEYVNIPTTLLAMVDSSIGGKTGINLTSGKNLCGAFWQPTLIIDDVDTLSTLPTNNFKDGLAEIIKYGILQNKAILDLLDEYEDNISLLIEESINTKLRFCQEDEHDLGKRRYLNLGHTIGHAIECASDYKVSHGSAVAIGTCALLRGLEAYNEVQSSTVKAIEDLYTKVGLPISYECDYENVFSFAIHDKKRNSDSIDLIVPNSIGSCEIKTFELKELKNIIRLGV